MMQPFDGVLIGEALMGDGPEIMFGPALAVVAKAAMDCVAGGTLAKKDSAKHPVA
jgi:formaldehyde-activating enzyme involved in methanogenesis